ncbi:MAG: hypothetical protein IKS60_07855 [Lachnospiraceae bacterium]|nr:hypothetical protein [Lachnospiraceae bacterium]
MAIFYDSLPEYREILAEIKEDDSEEARMNILKRCIDLADRNKDRYRQISYRLMAIEDTTFYGDSFQMYSMFPVVLKLSDEAFKEEGKIPRLFDILWDYKWLIEESNYYYQVSADHFERLVEDAIKRYLNAGNSPRPIYQQAARFFAPTNPKKAEEYYKLFLNTQRDHLSDCLACEKNNDVVYHLYIGQINKAMEIAEPLFTKRIKCTDSPYSTYLHCLLFASETALKGKMIPASFEANMAEYASDARKALVNRNQLVEQAGKLLIYYVLFDPGKALPFIRRFPDYTEVIRNPYGLYYFSVGMILFLKQLGGKETYKMKIDPRFKFYNSENTYKVNELYEYYLEIAKNIADNFSKSQGNNRMKDFLELALQH